MKANEIRNKVIKGYDVYWKNTNYKIIKDSIGQWLMHSQCNDYYCGVFDNNGNLVDKESDFFFTKKNGGK
jgi:hypothetical protein